MSLLSKYYTKLSLKRRSEGRQEQIDDLDVVYGEFLSHLEETLMIYASKTSDSPVFF